MSSPTGSNPPKSGAGVRTPSAAAVRRRLGEMLLNKGSLNRQKLDQALSMAKRTGERLGVVLERSGFARPEQVAAALAEQFRIGFLPPSAISRDMVDREAVKRVGLEVLRRHHLVPVVFQGTPALVLSDPLDTKATDAVERVLPKTPYLLTTRGAVDMLIEVLAFETKDAERIIESARESIDAGEMQQLVEYILGRAVLEKASDVHIEPAGLTAVVRYRVDGELRAALSIPRERHENLTNVLFGWAGVDLSDFTRLHDGRFSFKFSGRNLDVRFACTPSVEGPSIVMRILDDTRSLATLEELGYARWNLENINHLLRHPFGMVLVVGPTGSGKTTTLYSCLSRLNDGTTKILTVEDPVEIRVSTLQQVQVNDKAGVTFAKTVRSFLRMDPDVILIGEIRDEETAQEAFRAANTGHLVLSTLHANSAIEAVGRLVDLGMDPYQISTTLLGSFSQRLLRKLCAHCKKVVSMRSEDFLGPVIHNFLGPNQKMPETIAVAEKGPGCAYCLGGYAGRTVVAEVLKIEGELRPLVHQRTPNDLIIDRARNLVGFRSMMDNALSLIFQKEVSIEDAESTVGPLTVGAR